jgi:two-component system chemotaxis sensor kinase CheA
LDQHAEAYREEAYELLGELESALLELEDHPDDAELIGRVFRALHTIKGSGSMFGFDDIAAFTHEVESVFDLVREGNMEVSKELIDQTLSAGDLIKKMVDGENADKDRAGQIISAVKALRPDEGPAAQAEDPVGDPGEGLSGESVFRIRFRPAHDIFASGTNPILIIDELRELGECRVTAVIRDVPPLDQLDPEGCAVAWDVMLTTEKGENAIRDVFIFVEDESEIRIDRIEESLDTDDARSKKIGEILVERGDVSPEDVDAALSGQKRIGQILVESDLVDETTLESALVEQRHVEEKRKKSREKAMASSIRVAAEKLDTLVDLVGELVTVQATLSQKASLQEDPDLLSIAEEVERLTADLRDNTMSIRMMPIGTTFSRFRRLVRDLSGELGKDVVMTTEGGETELDKTVLDRLNDPMVHIIRNSIDHGIESPESRTAAGKPRQGKIHLSAAHSGANVIIRIMDDGAGLDPEAIREKAMSIGLINPEAEPTESDLYQVIFQAGFSTAGQVTDVSGRGVGMDVVKRSIETLRGTIEVDSERGRGTTITLKLPLTLAIIDGLLVEIGKAYFVLPLSTVEEVVELTRQDLEKNNGRNMARVRGDIVPYIPLRGLFNINGDTPPIQQIVIAEVEGCRIGFVVDQVIGEHQTVIKTLGRVYRDAKGFSGATILADGTVALILDVQKLTDAAEAEELAAVSMAA